MISPQPCNVSFSQVNYSLHVWNNLIRRDEPHVFFFPHMYLTTENLNEEVRKAVDVGAQNNTLQY